MVAAHSDSNVQRAVCRRLRVRIIRKPAFWVAKISLLALGFLSSSCHAPTPGQDPVASLVRRNMQPASAAFFIPSPIHRDEPVEAALEIGPLSVPPEELRRELERLAGRIGVGAADAIRVGPRMIASLVTDRECTITPKDPLDQAINLQEGAKWRWTVRPRKRGTIRATVTLMAPVIIHGSETSYRVTSFEETVTVTVTRSDIASDMLTWIKDYWVIVAAAGAGLGGGWAWLRKRRQRQKRGGFTS